MIRTGRHFSSLIFQLRPQVEYSVISQAKKPQNSLYATYLIVLILFIFAVFPRIILTHIEVIGWDESTFALVAQDVLKGHLPYTEMFDIKPPGLFFLLAGFMWLFGESVFSVRLFGALIIFGISILIFLFARKFLSRAPAALVSLVTVAQFMNSFALESGTELPSTLVFTASLILILSHRDKVWSAFLAGFFISLATLTRLNYALAVFVLGLLYAAGALLPALRMKRTSLLFYCLGGVLPLIAVLIPYWFSGHMDVFILSNLQAPLSYASTQLPPFEVARSFVEQVKNLAHNREYIFCSGVLLCMIGIASFFAKDYETCKKAFSVTDFTILALLFFSVFASILTSGTAHTHYFIMLYPFGAVLTVIALQSPVNMLRYLSIACIMVALTSAVALDGVWTIQRLRHPPTYPIYQLSRLIAEDKEPADEVWALEDHLVLFYLRQKPVSPIVTHPSNLFKASITLPLAEAGYISKDEIDKIFSSSPAYIVGDCESQPWYFDPQNKAKLQALLSRSYDIWQEREGICVFRKKKLGQA